MTDMKKVSYIWDESLITECDRLPAVPNRASIVNELIMAYGLHKHMMVVRSKPATYKELREFHSDLYLDHLKTLLDIDGDYIPSKEDVEYGIGYDCPPVSNMYDLVSTIAGGSITAARCLQLEMAEIAINWCGGWHHASRFGAEGFCYVNDIILAIEQLRQKYPKILYVDLDVHHGNAVEDAYNISNSVLTLSYHKLESGFYPGTGRLEDIGMLNGKGYTINFPLKEAYSDESLCYAFEQTFPLVLSAFEPDAIVVQCGADCLLHDPSGRTAVTLDGYTKCIQAIIAAEKPILLLGGGGYKTTNASKLWTSLTALTLGVDLDVNIPEHDYWTEYGPNYTLTLDSSLVKTKVDKAYLDECVKVIKDNVKTYLIR